jgi:hypothetical protein
MAGNGEQIVEGEPSFDCLMTHEILELLMQKQLRAFHNL